MYLAQLLSLTGLAAAVAVPRQASTQECTNPVKRVEFRTLDAATRKQYTDAVMCLSTKPSSIGLNTSLYDDFTYVHTHLNSKIHYVASFLPWHRYFTYLYEKQLNACGYTGPMVYWDWTLDVANVAGSDFWDPVNGVGGNGGKKVETTSDGRSWSCLLDGPFKDLRPAYSLTEYAPHCLSRDFFDGTSRPGNMRASGYTPELIKEMNILPDFKSFEFRLENVPHGSIHSAVGGQSGDLGPSSSPNDPIFFMHHAQVDRLWTLWQQADPETRNNDYVGIRERLETNGNATAPSGGNSTQLTPEQNPPAALTDMMPFMGLADDIPVSDVMTTQNSLLCYTY
ncbi:Di-copper centre-containing protein [Periconia macrospinosa]|uniref:Di-copper centre-containing protein n=1 Tax=Periconia macrospinosa TaxID=97972 RepID=A0A2V1E5D8_9PLEO|nr:Di-copper centre-containing protein [Periconia macrospinosa]